MCYQSWLVCRQIPFWSCLMYIILYLQWGDDTCATLTFIYSSANLKESANTVNCIFFDQCSSLIDACTWHFLAKALVMFDVRSTPRGVSRFKSCQPPYNTYWNPPRWCTIFRKPAHDHSIHTFELWNQSVYQLHGRLHNKITIHHVYICRLSPAVAHHYECLHLDNLETSAINTKFDLTGATTIHVTIQLWEKTHYQPAFLKDLHSLKLTAEAPRKYHWFSGAKMVGEGMSIQDPSEQVHMEFVHVHRQDQWILHHDACMFLLHWWSGGNWVVLKHYSCQSPALKWSNYFFVDAASEFDYIAGNSLWF